MALKSHTDQKLPLVFVGLTHLRGLLGLREGGSLSFSLLNASSDIRDIICVLPNGLVELVNMLLELALDTRCRVGPCQLLLGGLQLNLKFTAIL
jgi:hypothetical protein